MMRMSKSMVCTSSENIQPALLDTQLFITTVGRWERLFVCHYYCCCCTTATAAVVLVVGASWWKSSSSSDRGSVLGAWPQVFIVQTTGNMVVPRQLLLLLPRIYYSLSFLSECCSGKRKKRGARRASRLMCTLCTLDAPLPRHRSSRNPVGKPIEFYPQHS